MRAHVRVLSPTTVMCLLQIKKAEVKHLTNMSTICKKSPTYITAFEAAHTVCQNKMQHNKYCVILYQVNKYKATEYKRKHTLLELCYCLHTSKKQNYVPVHSVTNRKNKVLLFSKKENCFLCNNWLNIFVSTYVSPKIKMRNKTFPKISVKLVLFNNLCYTVFSILGSIMWARGRLETTENLMSPFMSYWHKENLNLIRKIFAIRKYETPKRKKEFWQDTELPALKW